VPSCVPPSDEKIDVKRLKDDIPKFFLSRSFEEHHQKWWMDFLSDKEAIFKVPDPPTTWPLEDIIRIKKGNFRLLVSQAIRDILRIYRGPQIFSLKLKALLHSRWTKYLR